MSFLFVVGAFASFSTVMLCVGSAIAFIQRSVREYLYDSVHTSGFEGGVNLVVRKFLPFAKLKSSFL